MKLRITVDVDPEDPGIDSSHSTGLTNEAYERLTGYTAEHGAGSLMWLGEIQDVEKEDDGRATTTTEARPELTTSAET